jgi:hypothetical protein
LIKMKSKRPTVYLDQIQVTSCKGKGARIKEMIHLIKEKTEDRKIFAEKRFPPEWIQMREIILEKKQNGCLVISFEELKELSQGILVDGDLEPFLEAMVNFGEVGWYSQHEKTRGLVILDKEEVLIKALR